MNFIFPFSWESHHPNWRTHSIIFQRDSSTINQWSIEFLWVNIDLPGFTHIYQCLLVIIGPSNYTYFITIDSSCLKKRPTWDLLSRWFPWIFPWEIHDFGALFFGKYDVWWQIWYMSYIWWYMMIYDNICLGNIHLKQIPKSHCPKTKHREILRAAFRGPHHRWWFFQQNLQSPFGSCWGIVSCLPWTMVSGHFRNRLIGGTYHIQGLCFGPM